MNVAVIFGGLSCEHEVSLKSAFNIIGSLDKEKYNIMPIGIDKEGMWRGPVPVNEIVSFDQGIFPEINFMRKEDRKGFFDFAAMEFTEIDFAFLITHGPYGEDGKLQGFLEMLEIPYCGAGVVGSAVGMDKIIMKQILVSENIPVVDFVFCTTDEIMRNIEKISAEIEEKMNYPVFVKPANLGSSVGIAKATDRQELTDSLRTAAAYDRRVIIEKGVFVREAEIAVLGNGDLLVSVPGEIIPGADFYDYEDKYINSGSRAVIPGNFPQETIKELQNSAEKIYRILDCAGFARLDFFVEKESGRVFFNEINTLPGFTDISMFPQLMKQMNLTGQELLDRIITLGTERYDEMRKYKEIIKK